MACRSYVMAKLTYISAVWAAELCAVTIGDIHWELGQWGRFVVQGKGARRSGPRERQAYLFQEGRDLLWRRALPAGRIAGMVLAVLRPKHNAIRQVTFRCRCPT